jgi:hypothetical protein
MVEEIRTVALVFLAVVMFSSLLGGILLAFAVRKLRSLNIPPDAGFAETLQFTPFIIVAAIDLLDLGLDFLAAPLSWAILDRLGLKALRGVAAVEALIPGTQFIPTMSLCWIGVRLLRIQHRPEVQKYYTIRMLNE